MMEWWTGGYFKAANHRVIAPPDDQRNHTRCGVFYFSIPNNDVRPDLIVDSPVLQKAGVKSSFKDGKTIDAKTFSRARVAKVGKSDLYKQPWGAGDRVVELIGR
jgi:isopenicillin N synthase-like dioxygenase